MLKRGITVSIFLICICMAAAVCTKAFMHDSGTASIQSIEDMQNIPFRFLRVLDAEWMKDDKVFYEEAEEAELILVVRPTGQIQRHSFNIRQEVEVIRVIDAQQEVSGKIWIETYNGFYIFPQISKDTLMNWSQTNLLYPEWEYLVFLRKYSWAPGFYYNRHDMGGLRLTDQVDDMILPDKKTYTYGEFADQKIYTYGELAECEFFADSAETLERLYEIKEDLLNTYYPKRADR